MTVYSVSQKVPPPNLFAVFLLRLCIFPLDFAQLLPIYFHTHFPILVYLSYNI